MQPEILSLPLVDRSADATAAQPDRAVRRKVTPGSKTARLLRTFLQRGEYGLSCFEAVSMAHDYVLRTSVSNLRLYGFTFHRKWETVPALGGTATADCVRYWFTEEDKALARELLGEAEEGADHA